MAQVVCGAVGSTRRQKVRRVLLLVSFILFPLTMNYMSPYLIVQGSFEGIVTGSALLFASMFIGSMLLGRLWCGWICPAAGIQEPVLGVNSRRVGRVAGSVKWVIWVAWLAAIGFGVYSAGGYQWIDPFYGTVGGISVAGDAERPIIFAYVIYLGVVFLFLALALLVGRRGGCQTVCWMAPFMISGRWLRNRLGAWPSLRLTADVSRCTRCGTCTANCPMSIDVTERVQSGSMEHAECILCGVCADACPQDVIRYTFRSGRYASDYSYGPSTRWAVERYRTPKEFPIRSSYEVSQYCVVARPQSRPRGDRGCENPQDGRVLIPAGRLDS